MKIIIVLGLAGVVLAGVYFGTNSSIDTNESADVPHSYSETEPEFEDMPDVSEWQTIPVGAPGKYTIAELQNWERQPGPLRVGLQVGHLNNQSMPEELENLERNTGAVWGSLTEADVNVVVAELVAAKLEAEGIVVDVLEAAVPPGYEADVFASIHADGNGDSAVNGFKFAAPRRDYAGTSEALVESLYETYGAATGLREDENISRRMTAYYAFNWPRYEYAIHPFTPAVIIEMGFLTSPVDRHIIVNQPERAAVGIVEGLLAYLAKIEDGTIVRQPLPTQFVEHTLPITGEVVCAPLRERWRQRAESGQCQPALRDQENQLLLLASHSSSTVAIGEQFTAVGQYVPVQSIPTYFWFPYEVVGVIVDPDLGMTENWYLR